MGSDRWKDPGGPWTGCLNSRNLDGHQQIKLPWYSMVVVGGQGGLWRGILAVGVPSELREPSFRVKKLRNGGGTRPKGDST